MTGTYPGFEGTVGRTFAGLGGRVAGAADAAAGRAERRRDAGRRPRLRRPRLLRLGDRHAEPRRARGARRPLARTSTPRRCARRPAPSLLTGLESHRAGFGTVAHLDPGFPGYAMELPARRGDDRRDPARPGGLRHDDGRQVAPGQGLGLLGRRSAALVAVPARASTASTGSSTRSRTCTSRTARRGQPPGRGRPLPRRLLLHRRPHRPRDLDDPRAQGEQPRAAVLPLLRPRRGARAAARPAGGHREVPGPLRRRLGPAARRAVRPPAASWASCPTDCELPPRNTEANHDVRPWDDLDEREQELFARHMEVYAAMVDRIDQNVGRLRRRARGAGRARQHDHRLPLRQRRVARGRGHRHDRVLRAPAPGRRHRRRLRAPRRDRRPADHAALPARLGDGVGHAVPALQDQHPPGRPLGAVLLLVARRARRARRDPRASTRTSPTCCRRCSSSSASSGRPTRNGVAARAARRGELRRDADATRTRRARTREQVYECNGHRGLYRDGWELVTLHQPLTPFADDGVGALRPRPRTRPSCATSRRTSPSGCAEMAAAWEELAWANQIYPLDEGSSIKYLHAARAQRGLRRAGDDPAGHADARALALGAAALVPVGHDHASTSTTARPTRGCSSRTATRARATRSTCSTASCSSCTTTGAAGCSTVSGGPMPDGVARGRRGPARHRAASSGSSRCRSTARSGRRAPGVPMLFGIAPFEGIDVGIDRRSPVSWEIYERFGPFPYTGALDSVTYTPGEPGPDAPARHDGHAARDGRRLRVSGLSVREPGVGELRLVSWARGHVLRSASSATPC